MMVKKVFVEVHICPQVIDVAFAESWVELAPSRASLCSSVEAVMVDRDGGEQASATKDSRCR